MSAWTVNVSRNRASRSADTRYVVEVRTSVGTLADRDFAKTLPDAKSMGLSHAKRYVRDGHAKIIRLLYEGKPQRTFGGR